MLEKGGATDQKSLPFKKVADAIEYQSLYGGKLHKISDIETTNEGHERNLQDYYILNLNDKAFKKWFQIH